MLAFDPTYRLSISEILCHPWMNQDVLMGDQLADLMNKKIVTIIEKKKAEMLKQMKNRGKKTNNKKPNRAINKQEEKVLFEKKPYIKETARITDRLIPKVNSFPEMIEVLSDMGGEFRYTDNNLELVKIFEDQKEIEDKVVIRIKV